MINNHYTKYIPCVCTVVPIEFIDEEWPYVLCSPPRVGERVQSKNGVSLIILRVSHRLLSQPEDQPIPVLELKLGCSLEVLE